MTLEEAIAHADAKGAGEDACVADHRQLARWLRELQQALELAGCASPSTAP